ncbi:hypothetical protein [Nonomuraea gerenzanensis]|uniref:Uncharacterized protein n=1 Tax=Nonomuraea gerenzanensis TaxID=93944 RepID=A0A1M4E2I2_9ACTN|nr:hypothetical protein [Nonomuraea gerenzanensis]UBU15234.1 hypothetical protein LCN96_09455 [Nonomuraea gerenzanensis]SBO92976.1 hypothetical protein BN4615_P2490 [Nonomuraea gerenzanensis]
MALPSLHEGLDEKAPVSDWPTLCRGLGPGYRHAWEKKLPLRKSVG